MVKSLPVALEDRRNLWGRLKNTRSMTSYSPVGAQHDVSTVDGHRLTDLVLRRSPQCCPGREIRDHCRTERTRRQEIQSHLETLGAVLDPADDEGSDITAEVADGIDQRNAGGGRRSGEEYRGHRPEGRP